MNFIFQWPITYNPYGRHLVVVAAPSQLPVHQIMERHLVVDPPTCTRCFPHHPYWPPPSRAWPQRPQPPTYSHCLPHPHLALPAIRWVNNALVHRGQQNKIFMEVKMDPTLLLDPSIRYETLFIFMYRYFPTTIGVTF